MQPRGSSPAVNLFAYIPQVLITLGTDGCLAQYEVLNVLHNGTNPAEIARVRHDHPGKSECIQYGRVLGTLAPFRCKFFPPNNNQRHHHRSVSRRVHSDNFSPFCRHWRCTFQTTGYFHLSCMLKCNKNVRSYL